MTLFVRDFEAREFRSLKKISYPMSNLDVFVGANGVGKTNLYRALELLRSAAANTLARDLARDGGLESVMWAGGRRRSEPARIRLSVGLADTAVGRSSGAAYRYEVEVGFPPIDASAAFVSEPQIKAETLSFVGGTRPHRLLDRDGYAVMARGEDGRPARIDMDLLASETVLGRLDDQRFYAMGCAGHGVPTSLAFARDIAGRMLGKPMGVAPFWREPDRAPSRLPGLVRHLMPAVQSAYRLLDAADRLRNLRLVPAPPAEAYGGNQ